MKDRNRTPKILQRRNDRDRHIVKHYQKMLDNEWHYPGFIGFGMDGHRTIDVRIDREEKISLRVTYHEAVKIHAIISLNSGSLMGDASYYRRVPKKYRSKRGHYGKGRELLTNKEALSIHDLYKADVYIDCRVINHNYKRQKMR